MTNVVVLRGRISRPAAERVLPSGDRLTSLDLTVPTEPGREPERAESVPLTWSGAPAWVSELQPGSELVVVGRVRRRFFRAGERLQSRTEVVVEGAAPVRQVSRVTALVRRATDTATRGAVPSPPPPARQRARPTFE